MTLCFVCEHSWAQMIFLQFHNAPIWVSKYFLVLRDNDFSTRGGWSSHPSPPCPCVWLERHEVFLQSMFWVLRANRSCRDKTDVESAEWELCMWGSGKRMLRYFFSFNRYLEMMGASSWREFETYWTIVERWQFQVICWISVFLLGGSSPIWRIFLNWVMLS